MFEREGDHMCSFCVVPTEVGIYENQLSICDSLLMKSKLSYYQLIERSREESREKKSSILFIINYLLSHIVDYHNNEGNFSMSFK